MKKFLIVGAGGREAAFATRLADDTELYAVISHANHLIIDCVNRTGGACHIGDPSDPETVLNFAKRHSIDYAFISSDRPLANGVVDTLLENGFRAIGGTRQATRIEWDKVYSIGVMNNLCPEFTPFYMTVSNQDELEYAMSEFESREIDVVVKPQGLTGGKGVKVMPEHLKSYEECAKYAAQLMGTSEKVLLVEKLHGIEFTIMGITDGQHMVLSPASYDYPFRYEDDCGAGTGGMGCFTDSEKKPFFMTDRDMQDCMHIMQKIIDDMRSRNLFFNGVLNAGFFKTRHGIRFMEFNGRFGDPEGVNILSVLDGSFSELLICLWDKTLSDVSFVRKASVVKYLVAPEYPYESEKAILFDMDEDSIRDLGVRIFPASCVKSNDGKHQYRTLKKSRVCAFCAVSDSIEEASSMVDMAISSYVDGPLEYRKDIGSGKSIEKLRRIKTELEGKI